MNRLTKLWRRVKWAVVGRPAPRPRPIRVAPFVQPKPRRYPTALGGSAIDILRLLEAGPKTRYQIEDGMNTKTAGIHLPRLRERGYVVSDWSGRRMIYAVTPEGVQALRAAETQP